MYYIPNIFLRLKPPSQFLTTIFSFDGLVLCWRNQLSFDAFVTSQIFVYNFVEVDLTRSIPLDLPVDSWEWTIYYNRGNGYLHYIYWNNNTWSDEIYRSYLDCPLLQCCNECESFWLVCIGEPPLLSAICCRSHLRSVSRDKLAQLRGSPSTGDHPDLEIWLASSVSQRPIRRGPN